MRARDTSDLDCAIAQAAGVVGDWWSLLIVREVVGGTNRFEALQRELGVSRKVLTQRLNALVEHGVLQRVPYQDKPVRHDYVLTAAGEGLLPVLVSLQDWGTRFVMGDGSLTATSASTSLEARRVNALLGGRVPPLHLAASDDTQRDPVSDLPWTVIYCFPGAFAPAATAYPRNWRDVPGAAGCTLESTTYRDHAPAFAAVGAAIYGVSTQRPDQLAQFADHVNLPFPLLSDEDSKLTAALRLPTFRASGQLRLKRVTLIVSSDRRVRHVQFPIADPAASVSDALRQIVDPQRPRHPGTVGEHRVQESTE